MVYPNSTHDYLPLCNALWDGGRSQSIADDSMDTFCLIDALSMKCFVETMQFCNSTKYGQSGYRYLIQKK